VPELLTLLTKGRSSLFLRREAHHYDKGRVTIETGAWIHDKRLSDLGSESIAKEHFELCTLTSSEASHEPVIIIAKTGVASRK
jgi:hypothetical protein